MDTVVLDGVRYVKAAVAAKEFKYTTDYIGQLCRAGKIDAQLVGRTWFVNLDSIKAYKKNKHQRKAEKKKEDALNQKILNSPLKVKKKVAPVLSAKTIKAIRDSFHNPTLLSGSSRTGERNLKVSYELDDESLLPTLHKKPSSPPKKIRIEPAGAKKVSVRGERKEIEFTTTPIPEITLSGKIKISEVPDNLPTAQSSEDSPLKTRKNKKNKDISVSEKKQTKVEKATFISRLQEAEVKMVKGVNKPANLLQDQKSFKVKVGEDSKKTESDLIDSRGKVRSGIKNESVGSFVSTLAGGEQTMMPLWFRLLPLWATLLAVLVSAGIFAASYEVWLTDNAYSAQTVFRLDNLLYTITDKSL